MLNREPLESRSDVVGARVFPSLRLGPEFRLDYVLEQFIGTLTPATSIFDARADDGARAGLLTLANKYIIKANVFTCNVQGYMCAGNVCLHSIHLGS